MTITLPRTADAPAPTPFGALAGRCRSFTQAKAWVGVGGEPMLVYADGAGQWVADTSSTRRRYSWDGVELRRDARGGSEPRWQPHSARATGLWKACRSGFAGATWIPIEDPSDLPGWGRASGWHWGRIVLPDAWARDLHLYVSFNRSGTRVQRVIIGGGGSPWHRIGVQEIVWWASFPREHLGPDAPSSPPPPHPDWLPPPYDEREQLDIFKVGGSPEP